MKKKLVSLLLCGILLVELTGCGTSSNNNLNTKNQSTEEQKIITCLKDDEHPSYTETNIDQIYLENGIFVKSVFTEIETYHTEDAYKDDYDYKCSRSNTECNDDELTVTRVKTYLKEDISEGDISEEMTSEDGTVDIDTYISSEEKMGYTCSIK